MSTVLEVNDSGALLIPPTILPDRSPKARYLASVREGQIIISKEEVRDPFWKRATPEERAADILRWAASHRDGPGLPDSAVGRDAIYD